MNGTGRDGRTHGLVGGGRKDEWEDEREDKRMNGRKERKERKEKKGFEVDSDEWNEWNAIWRRDETRREEGDYER